MRTVAVVMADFDEAPLGGAAQLLTLASGRPILRRTLERVSRLEACGQRGVLVRPTDEQRMCALLNDWGLRDRLAVWPIDSGRRVERRRIQAARRWQPDGWRGSPLATTWFDEYVAPAEVARVVATTESDAALVLDGHMPLLATELNDQLVRHFAGRREEAAFAFAAAPPGLVGVVVPAPLLQQLGERDLRLGSLLGYRPQAPRADLLGRAECCQLDRVVAQAAGRLAGDTRRSRERIEQILAIAGEGVDGVTACAWLHGQREQDEPWPSEVEVELTTEDPLPETRLRPRGRRVPARRLEDVAALGARLSEMAASDDTRLVLGGHGDPLCSPAFPTVVQRAREAGIRAIAVNTPLVRPVTEELLAALGKVDVVAVQLDADSVDRYRDVHLYDGYSAVMANFDQVEAWRRRTGSATPILVPTMIRCAQTLPGMEAFFDFWTHHLGTAVILGHSSYGGLLPSDTLEPSAPPVRQPCRRLSRRAMLLADGGVPLCDQDVAGATSVADWRTATVGDCWAAAGRRVARERHAGGAWAGLPICGTCTEWHRH